MNPRTKAATIAIVVVVSGSMFLWFLSRNRVTDAPEASIPEAWIPDVGAREQVAAPPDLPSTAPLRGSGTASGVAIEEPSTAERPPAALMKNRYLLTGRLVSICSARVSTASAPARRATSS